MFRRTNGRPPPLLLGGLILFIIILSYSYWTLNTQNNDVLQSVEKLQANLKIGDVKIEQNERKMSALQDLLHEKEEAIKQSENKLLQQEDNIKIYNNDLKKRDYEISTLKEEIGKLHEKMQTMEDKMMECEGDNEKILKENDLLISQRDDAVSALDHRDVQISELNRKLDQERVRNDQLDANMSALTRELALAHTRLVEAKDAGPPHLSQHAIKAVASSSSPAAGAAAGGGGVVALPQSPNQDQAAGVLPQPLKDSAERHAPMDVGPVAAGNGPLVGVAPPLARSGRSSPLLSSTSSPFPAQQLLPAAPPAPQHVVLRPYSHQPGASSPNMRPKQSSVAAPKMQYKLSELNNYQPAQYSFNNQQLGMNQQPLRMNLQPLAVNQQPLGVNHQPMGMVQHPSDMNQQILRMNQQPLGMNHQLLRMDHQQQQLYPVLQPHEQRLENYVHQQQVKPVAGEPFDLSQYHNRADFAELQQAVRLLTKQRPLQPLRRSAEETGHQPPRDVLPQPPGFQDNLDAAVDEVARPGEEDPLLPDQDPGGEVARQEHGLQDPRLHQHSVNDGGEGRLDRFGGGEEDEEVGAAIGANNQDFVDDGGNLVGGRGLDSPLIPANKDDNEGGEVETGDQQPAPADQDLLENGAKENFFGDNPPLRLHINGNNDNMLANDKQNPLDDNNVMLQ